MHAGGFELLADESQTEEPAAEGVFRVVGFRSCGACRLAVQCLGTDGKAKLDVAFDDYNRPEKGVPSLAFQVTTAEKTYLFPGDVRDYEHCRMPVDCDVVFSHVWLGRGCATANREDTALDKYLHFVRALRPKLLLLTHLYDIRRLEKEQWTYKHALWIKHALQNTEIHVEAPVPGENVIIAGGNKCNEQA